MIRVYHHESIESNRVTLVGSEAHHLTRVRRVGAGELIILFDGRGGVFEGRVESVDRRQVEVAILNSIDPRPEPPVILSLATAVPKGDRFDWFVEKATELGVARIIPIRTERSVVDPRSSKLDRLRNVVIEACKQSGRDRLLEIDDPIRWIDLIADVSPTEGYIAHPGGASMNFLARPDRVTLAIGPEGGFTDPEVDQAVALGWHRVGLGPNLLRIETAALAASAAILLG